MKYFITITLILILLYQIGNIDWRGSNKKSKKQKKKAAKMAKMKYAKWIGGGLGWAFGGPIGGILGFLFGSMVDGVSSGDYEYRPTQRGDFSISLLILSAAVMKADEKVMKSELEYVRQFFIHNFGLEVANQRIQMLQEILKQNFNLQEVCAQIERYMEYPARLQLLHYLFGIAAADGHYNPKEVEMVDAISSYLHIDRKDYESIRAMFVRDIDSVYKVLEIPPEASDEEVKAAYRKMAVKYHPDKVEHLGPEIRKSAEEKFQQLQAAYEEIKKRRRLN